MDAEECIRSLAEGRPRAELELIASQCTHLIQGACNIPDPDDREAHCFFCVSSHGPGSKNEKLIEAWKNYV